MTKLNGRQFAAVGMVMCIAMVTTAESQVFKDLADFEEKAGHSGQRGR